MNIFLTVDSSTQYEMETEVRMLKRTKLPRYNVSICIQKGISGVSLNSKTIVVFAVKTEV